MLGRAMSTPRAEKYCYECGTVVPRAAPTCWSCSAEQPPLPASAAGNAPRPGDERPCSACGRSISTRAELCVHCGVRQQAPPPTHGRHEWDASHALLATGAVLVLMMALSMRDRSAAPVAPVAPAAPVASASASAASPAPAASPGPAFTEADAWGEARRLVMEHLRAPPGVEHANEHQTTRLGPDRFEVKSYFEMPNTSDVRVRTNWTAVIGRQNGEWRIERLEAKN
jgi:hypothetical protein